MLFADEAFFAGDRSHESILKALITEETLMIEPKGVDPFAVRNCLHLIMSSNNDWVIPAGADARRYFVLGVSDATEAGPRLFRRHRQGDGCGWARGALASSSPPRPVRASTFVMCRKPMRLPTRRRTAGAVLIACGVS